MTEIDKMYENAGIKGEWRDYRTKNGKIYEGKNPKNRNIRLCKPRFTAEKQIEIVCFLINRGVELSFKCEQGKINTQAIQRSLAEVINKLWQSLTDQEKEEIRGILK